MRRNEHDTTPARIGHDRSQEALETRTAGSMHSLKHQRSHRMRRSSKFPALMLAGTLLLVDSAARGQVSLEQTSCGALLRVVPMLGATQYRWSATARQFCFMPPSGTVATFSLSYDLGTTVQPELPGAATGAYEYQFFVTGLNAQGQSVATAMFPLSTTSGANWVPHYGYFMPMQAGGSPLLSSDAVVLHAWSGSPVNLSTSVASTSPIISTTWFRDGIPQQNGSFTCNANDHGAVFFCEVSNACGTSRSRTTTLSVASAPTLQVGHYVSAERVMRNTRIPAPGVCPQPPYELRQQAGTVEGLVYAANGFRIDAVFAGSCLSNTVDTRTVRFVLDQYCRLRVSGYSNAGPVLPPTGKRI